MGATRYLTTEEAAERLGLDGSRVRRLCAEGRLGRKIGRNWAISEADLQRFAQEERRPGRPPADKRRK